MTEIINLPSDILFTIFDRLDSWSIFMFFRVSRKHCHKRKKYEQKHGDICYFSNKGNVITGMSDTTKRGFISYAVRSGSISLLKFAKGLRIPYKSDGLFDDIDGPNLYEMKSIMFPDRFSNYERILLRLGTSCDEQGCPTGFNTIMDIVDIITGIDNINDLIALSLIKNNKPAFVFLVRYCHEVDFKGFHLEEFLIKHFKPFGYLNWELYDNTCNRCNIFDISIYRGVRLGIGITAYRDSLEHLKLINKDIEWMFDMFLDIEDTDVNNKKRMLEVIRTLVSDLDLKLIVYVIKNDYSQYMPYIMDNLDYRDRELLYGICFMHRSVKCFNILLIRYKIENQDVLLLDKIFTDFDGAPCLDIFIYKAGIDLVVGAGLEFEDIVSNITINSILDLSFSLRNLKIVTSIFGNTFLNTRKWSIFDIYSAIKSKSMNMIEFVHSKRPTKEMSISNLVAAVKTGSFAIFNYVNSHVNTKIDHRVIRAALLESSVLTLGYICGNYRDRVELIIRNSGWDIINELIRRDFISSLEYLYNDGLINMYEFRVPDSVVWMDRSISRSKDFGLDIYRNTPPPLGYI